MPPTVYKDKHGKYWVLDGHRRMMARRKLNEKDIKEIEGK